MEYDFSFYGLATDINPPLKVSWQETKRTVNLSNNSHAFSFFAKGAKQGKNQVSSWGSKKVFFGLMRFQRSGCFSKSPAVSESICFGEWRI